MTGITGEMLRAASLACRNAGYGYIDHKTMRAALLAALGESHVGWQPIETAPRYGENILGYWKPSVEGGAWDIAVTCWIAGNWTNPDDVEAHYGEPSHWMPLPAPPAADSSPERGGST